MGLIMTDLKDWALEHCSSPQDVEECIRELQEVKNNWVSDETEKEFKLNKYRVHAGYRYTIDLNVLASTEDKAKEIADEYASSLPITDERFYCADGDVDAWEEDFNDEDVDLSEEEY